MKNKLGYCCIPLGINEGLKKKEFTSVEVTNSCIERIKSVEDKVKAFVTLTFDLALKQAEEADKIISEN